MASVIGRIGLLATVAAVGLSACASSSGSATSSQTSSVVTVQPVPQTVTTTPATTLAGQVPTLFNCGGGAYQPATILVVCGVATTTVTGVKWTSWTATGASGTGTVHLTGQSGGTPANLSLSAVVSTPNGPQFSVLEATWTGASPDGKPSEVFHLALAK